MGEGCDSDCDGGEAEDGRRRLPGRVAAGPQLGEGRPCRDHEQAGRSATDQRPQRKLPEGEGREGGGEVDEPGGADWGEPQGYEVEDAGGRVQVRYLAAEPGDSCRPPPRHQLSARDEGQQVAHDRATSRAQNAEGQRNKVLAKGHVVLVEVPGQDVKDDAAARDAKSLQQDVDEGHPQQEAQRVLVSVSG